jgi:hypothetical protein
MEASYARQVWHLIETIHAVTYFADECRRANADVGLKGFWMGYFASRAAPMGEVAPGVVTATFFNFHEDMVNRAIPDAWSYATANDVLDARQASAASVLRRLVPNIEDVADAVLTLLWRVLDAAEPGGRPLFAANRELEDPDDLVAELWQAMTSMREHRGDGHVACLTSEGVGGCESHVLFAATEGTPPELLQQSRGWSPEEWAESARFLRQAGLLDAEGEATERAYRLREQLERRTDELAVVPYGALTDEQRDRLLEVLAPPAHAIVKSDLIPFPNPIGLPPAGSSPGRSTQNSLSSLDSIPRSSS